MTDATRQRAVYVLVLAGALLCASHSGLAEAMAARPTPEPPKNAAGDTPAVSLPAEPDAAKPVTLDVVLANMENARIKLKTYQADVVKLRRIEVLGETEKFTGSIQFKMPRLLRLELTEAGQPRETWYIVGDTYGWIIHPQRNQAERAKLAKMDAKTECKNPLEYGLARPIHELRKVYTIKLLTPERINKAPVLPLELTPRKKEYATGKLMFWIDPKSWLPVQLREYKSNNEIVETHTFSNPILNKNVKDKVFRFKPPKDMDVIIHEMH